MLRLLRHYFYFVPAQLSKAKGIGKNILLKLQLVIRISLTASPHHHVIFATSLDWPPESPDNQYHLNK